MSNMKKRILIILGILVLLWGVCYYYMQQVTTLIHNGMITRSYEMTEDAAHLIKSRLRKDTSQDNIRKLKVQLNEAKLFGERGRMHLVDVSGREVLPASLDRQFSCAFILPGVKEKFPELAEDSFLTSQQYAGVYRVDDISYSFSYAPVGINDWYVAAIVPLDVSFYYTQQALRLIFILVGAMVLILGIIAAYLIYETNDKRRQLYKMAYEDDVTCLGNKNRFFAAMSKIAAAQTSDLWCLLFVDIHNFKWVNDSLGLAVGNEVLGAVGKLLLADYTGSGEVAMRLTADKFLVLKPLIDWQEPRAYAESILHRIGLISVAGKKLNLKASVGGVLFRSDSVQDGHTVLDAASKAQATAARQLENPIVFYDEAVITKYKEENILVEELKAAIKNNELEVFYQPKYNPYKNTIIGAEALVRWKHATKGYILPGVFIPLAENKGLVWEITRFVFAQVCSDIKQWREAKLPLLPVSVNLSTHDLFQNELFSFLLEALNTYGRRAEEIELEVTETGIMDDLPRALSLLRKLKNLGFKLDIDDFGTGYSALSYLQVGIFDVIKLDRSFILQRDKYKDEGEKLITSVLALGRNLGLKCICEGVETKEQVEFLKTAGCEGIQGFYFAKPMSEQEFRKLLLKL